MRDPTGGAIPAVPVTARNTATGVTQTAQTNAEGFYAFPSLAVGQYEVEVSQPGFKPYKRTGLVADVNTKLQVDISLELGQQSESITVSESAVQVETQSSQMGDVVTGSVMTAVALNGRSFTDLLSLQPGIVPMSTQTSDSIVMSGVTVAITPSGGLNPGNQSISGQREDANGFLVNGSDVKEEMNGGTSIIPDLDSLAEFRVHSLYYFNPGAFTDNALGTVGDAPCRYFSGPGMFDTDLALQRNFQIRESKVLRFRLETFNIFNQAQFLGPAAVNGNVGSPLFGQVVNAAPPRLMQLALKYTF